MRRQRVLILLLIVLPVYIWLLMVAGMIAVMLLVEPTELDVRFLLDVINPLVWYEELLRDSWVLGLSLMPAVLLATTQIAFVVPAFGFRLRAGRRSRRPLWLTLIAAALVGCVLSMGLLYGLAELVGLWDDGEPWPFEGLESIFGTSVGYEALSLIVFWAQVLVGWVIWIPLLYWFTRHADPRRLHNRLALVLLGGTILEVLVVVPIDVMVRRRTDCYCATGTFIALCCSVWALLWLTGPGIVLALTSRRRRRWAATHCSSCGYAKGPSPGTRCPECGYAWSGEDRG